MQCLHACPNGEGELAWDCGKCDIDEGGDCTPGLTTGCCKAGECFRKDQFHSECLRECQPDWDCRCTLSEGEECSTAGSSCCDPTLGLRCFEQNQQHSECLANCPWGQDPPWNCECAITEGGECTDPNAGCCHHGLECVYANASYAACLTECPADEQPDWACAECTLHLGAECTDPAGGCCQSGRCVQHSPHYSECRLECPVGKGWDCEKCAGQAGDSCGGPDECCDSALGLACFKQAPGQWQCRERCPEGEGWACETCALEVHDECSEENTAAPGCCRSGECFQKDRWQSQCEFECPQGMGWECEVCEIEAGGECTNPDSGCCADGTTCFRKHAFYSQCRQECALGVGWDCEGCVLPEGANCHDPSTGCCVSGTQCQQQNAEYSQCLRQCPQGEGWDCEVCSIQEFGECTGSPGCCRRGTSCYKKDDTFSQCLQECPGQDWECACGLLALDDCTSGGGCCQSGTVCLQKDQTLAVCLSLDIVRDLLNSVVGVVDDLVEDVEVVGLPIGSILTGLTGTVTGLTDTVVETISEVVDPLLANPCKEDWQCPSVCVLSEGQACADPQDGCCFGNLRCYRQDSLHAECLLACPEGWACDVPPAPCPNGKLDQAGRCWQYFGEAQTWEAAERGCVDEGLQLASVHSAEERSFIFDLVSKYWQDHSVQGNFWLGGRVEAWAWEWTDGSSMQYMPWLGYMPTKSWDGCVSMVLTSRTVHSSDGVECEARLPSLCASPPNACPSGSYGPGGTDCLPCPDGASSVPGQNLGVLACECPVGSALTHNSKHAALQERKCVPVTDVNCTRGIHDAADGRCWVWVAEEMVWEEAQQACAARGLHLASLAADGELQLLKSVLFQRGLHSGRMVWLGATKQPEAEGGPLLWHWTDGTALAYLPWDLGAGEPNSRYGYAQFCGAARIRRYYGMSSLSFADQFCNEKHAAVCASTPQPCPAGTYGPKNPDCIACPMSGTSVVGGNTDVLACVCPSGYTMSVGGPNAEPTCVETEGKCSGGVWDATTERCWKLITTQSTFEAAASACEAEGLVLASTAPADSAAWGALVRSNVRAGTSLAALAVWVGGKVGSVAGPRVWEWIDGSTMNAFPWDTQGEPHLTADEACLALRWDLADSRAYGLAVDCNEPLPALCAEPPVACPAGQYGPSKGFCSECPHGGGSMQGRNHGVLACECPPGEAMAYGGDTTGECVVEEAEECNGGVWDVGMRRCWRLLPPAPTWAGAQKECERWGLSLASLHAFYHTRIASALFVARSLAPHGVVWVGASDARNEGEWEWADGSRAVAMPWLSGEPDNAGRGEDCSGVRQDGMLLDVACAKEELGELLQGVLCATPAGEAWQSCAMPGEECKPVEPCPADYYGNGFECERCPAGASSSAAASGESAGVLGCKCGEGQALAHNWWARGEERFECVNASACEGGVVEAASGRCWRLFENQPRGDWSRKRAYCQRWGGDLADVSGASGWAMLRLLLDSAGFNASAALSVWVRAHTALPEPAAPTVKPGNTSCPAVQWDAAGLEARSDLRCNATLEVPLFICEAQTSPLLDSEEAVLVHSACAGCQFVRVGSNRTLARAGMCALACRSLALAGVGARGIHHRTFNLMPGVRFLSLAHNELADLEDPHFAGLSTLTSLDLSHNLLARIGPGALAGLGPLASLSLADNALQHLPPGLLDEMRTLHVLFLAGNPLQCQPTFRFAVHVLDRAWPTLPPCLPLGCRAEKPAFGRDALLHLGQLHSSIFSTLTVMSMMRGDAVVALDQANMAEQLYAEGADGQRFWCVATLESFDPSRVFGSSVAQAAAKAWDARPKLSASEGTGEASAQGTVGGDNSSEGAYLGLVDETEARGSEEGSATERGSEGSASDPWVRVVVGMTSVVVGLGALLGLAKAGQRWRRLPRRRRPREVSTGDAGAAGMHALVARLEQVWQLDAQSLAWGASWRGRERVYSLPSSPACSQHVSPLSRTMQVLEMASPLGQDGRQRVGSTPSSIASTPTASSFEDGERGRLREPRNSIVI